MARATSITFAQVAQIADTMKAAGTRPTARAVRERIGSGSMGTIHNLLKQYNGHGQAEESEAAELPDSIATALMDFVQTEIATACEPIAAMLIESKESADALANENERLEALIDRLKTERDNAQRAQAISEGENNKLERQLAETRDELKETHRGLMTIREDLTTASNRADTLEALPHQIEILREQVEKYNLAKLEAEKATAVMAAKLEAAEERATDRALRADNQERRVNELQQETKTANMHYQACAARLEEAARTIEGLKAAKVSSTPKVTKPKITSTKEAS